MVSPPQHSQVLVIGGGPSGSYAASVLAREGFDVTLFEATKFPRYHIGESLIPSVRHYLRFIGAEEKLINHGFMHKPGAAIKFNQYKREGYTDFVAIGHNNSSWNVVRSEFDELLLNHARSLGVSVYEQTKVTSVSFSPTDPDKPVSVTWTHTPTSIDGAPADMSKTMTGTTTFAHMVDATGRAGIMSTGYLKNRHFNASLKNVAVWGYWKNAGSYGVGTKKAGAPYFEALADESGWAWFIPLHNGTTSVGIVMNQEVYLKNGKLPFPPSPFAASATPNPSNSTMTARYVSCLSLAKEIVKLITPAGSMQEGSVKSASDFSYSAPSYAGRGYRIVGDAGAFIDPFFSSGIHLALTSAMSAATSICASIRGDCSENDAAEWHTKRVATSYTRFQVVVLSAYKQIRAQEMNVLSDIDEDNYDRAFSFLRPVIQGAADVGARLSEMELQKSLDFCVNLFNPTTPEQHEQLFKAPEIGQELFDASAPLLNPDMFKDSLRVQDQTSKGLASRLEHPDASEESDLDSSDGSDSERAAEMKMVVDKVNARRLIHAEYEMHNLEAEDLAGYVVRLERGKLGLVKVE